MKRWILCMVVNVVVTNKLNNWVVTDKTNLIIKLIKDKIFS